MSDAPAPENQQSPGVVGQSPAESASAGNTSPTDQTWPMVPPPISAAPPPVFPVRAVPQVPPAPQVPARKRSPDAAKRSPSARRTATPPPPQVLMPARAVQPERLAPTRRSAPVAPKDSGLYLPWWSLVVMVGVVGVAAFALVWVFTEMSGPVTPGDQSPQVIEITALPTLGQEFTGAGQAAAPAGGAWPTPIPQAQPTATVALPTPVPTQTLPPGEFVIGARVRVVGVEATKLNVRAAPGLSGDLVFMAEEGDLFAIVGGPQNADGYEWWKLQRIDDPSRVGWAVRNFLTGAAQ